ncbi:MAG: acylglycerol kinase family protein [bacterium]
MERAGTEIGNGAWLYHPLFHGISRTCHNSDPQALEEGADQIIAVGGDGTVNEVVNGWFENDQPINPETSISVMMCGSGCDFQRSLVQEAFVHQTPEDNP